MYETISLDTPQEHVALLTLDRPELRNALNTKMAEELAEVFSKLRDEKSARAIILTGAGDKAFCAGADLKERNGMSREDWDKQHKIFEQMIESIAGVGIPVIAKLNGVAFGGGLEIALACSFACAVEGSRFSFSEVRLGIIPGLGGIYRLTNQVGAARAKELLFTAKVFSSEEGLEWGLFNHIFAGKELEEEVMKIATQISENAPLAVQAAGESSDQVSGRGFADWTALERKNYNSLIETKDRKEGILAFNEKRKADFRGT